MEALGDSTRSGKVEILRKELRSAIEELKRKKDLFEIRLFAQLEIQKKRSELDVLGKNAKKATIREDLPPVHTNPDPSVTIYFSRERTAHTSNKPSRRDGNQSKERHQAASQWE